MAKKKTTSKKKSKDKKAKPLTGQPERNTKGQFVKGNNEGTKFPPGQSGNPKGPPKHRVNLWPLFCKYMSMADAELGKLDRSKLTLAQQAALGLAEDMRDRKYSGSQRLARHVFDRDEGRPIEHVKVGPDNILSDEECERIRQSLKNNVN